MRRRVALVGAAALTGLPAGAQSASITGSAAYRERVALPPGAVLEVALEDISRADAPAETLALVTVLAQHQVPIPFTLAYDRARIDPAHRYAVRGGLLVDGKVMWCTDTVHPVLTQGAGNTAELRLVRAAPPPPALVGTNWVAEDIEGKGVLDRARSSLLLGDDGHASGLGGCNRFNGGYTLAGDRLGFGAIAATMMACSPALGEQEQRFFRALGAVQGWRIETGLLHLLDATGATLIRLAALP
jgi:putative lipoprotein